MSKQSEAKTRMGYITVLETCGNCAFFTSTKTSYTGVFGGRYTIEKGRICTIGGFAVKKMATCKEWKQI